MRAISLITDFGLDDSSTGVMKAVILKINPRAKIIDICHQVSPQDIPQAAFLLESSFNYFPKGTIHLVVVDPGVGSKRRGLIVKTKNYFFIGPDNGVLALALKKEPPEEAVGITNREYFLKPTSKSFHGRDIFAPLAAYLSKGKEVSAFGKRVASLQGLRFPPVIPSADKLTGEIIHIDHFGNLISNISEPALAGFTRDKKFRICIRGRKIDRLAHAYSASPLKKTVALINSLNYLEIAINCASAAKCLNAHRGDKIEVIKT